MSTSIIDYIFRELAVSYLGRHDLAHVSQEDLSTSEVHRHQKEPEFESEQLVSERTLSGKEAKDYLESEQEYSDYDMDVSIIPEAGGSNLQYTDGSRLAGDQWETIQRSQTELVQEARQKGYEGESCSTCGQFTMVRNGSCLKCASCGATSGCS